MQVFGSDEPQFKIDGRTNFAPRCRFLLNLKQILMPRNRPFLTVNGNRDIIYKSIMSIRPFRDLPKLYPTLFSIFGEL